MYPLLHRPPRIRGQEALIHVLDHPHKLLHGDGEGEHVLRDKGPRRNVEHPEDAPGAAGAPLEVRIGDDRGAAGAARREDLVRLCLIKVCEREQTREDIGTGEEDDDLRIVGLLEKIPPLEDYEAGGRPECWPVPEHLPDELRGLPVAFALDPARDPEGEEVLEVGPEAFAEAEVPFPAGAGDRLRVEAEGHSLPDRRQRPYQAPGQRAGPGKFGTPLLVRVVEGYGELRTVEVLIPARDKPLLKFRIHDRFPKADYEFVRDISLSDYCHGHLSDRHGSNKSPKKHFPLY